MDTELKNQAEQILQTAGLSSEEAITLLYQHIVAQGQLPSFMLTPNQLTLQTFEETDRGENVTVCDNLQEMFSKLNL